MLSCYIERSRFGGCCSPALVRLVPLLRGGDTISSAMHFKFEVGGFFGFFGTRWARLGTWCFQGHRCRAAERRTARFACGGQSMPGYSGVSVRVLKKGDSDALASVYQPIVPIRTTATLLRQKLIGGLGAESIVRYFIAIDDYL